MQQFLSHYYSDPSNSDLNSHQQQFSSNKLSQKNQFGSNLSSQIQINQKRTKKQQIPLKEKFISKNIQNDCFSNLKYSKASSISKAKTEKKVPKKIDQNTKITNRLRKSLISNPIFEISDRVITPDNFQFYLEIGQSLKKLDQNKKQNNSKPNYEISDRAITPENFRYYQQIGQNYKKRNKTIKQNISKPNYEISDRAITPENFRYYQDIGDQICNFDTQMDDDISQDSSNDFLEQFYFTDKVKYNSNVQDIPSNHLIQYQSLKSSKACSRNQTYQLQQKKSLDQKKEKRKKCLRMQSQVPSKQYSRNDTSQLDYNKSEAQKKGKRNKSFRKQSQMNSKEFSKHLTLQLQQKKSLATNFTKELSSQKNYSKNKSLRKQSQMSSKAFSRNKTMQLQQRKQLANTFTKQLINQKLQKKNKTIQKKNCKISQIKKKAIKKITNRLKVCSASYHEIQDINKEAQHLKMRHQSQKKARQQLKKGIILNSSYSKYYKL